MDFINIKNEKSFDKYAIVLFNYHFKKNKFYRAYCESLNINNSEVDQIEKIPFFPIIFFKNKKILIDNIDFQKLFKSSGTGGSKSSHYIHKIDDYHISIEKCFERIYGKVTDYVIIGVTPNYTTKKTSSLIYMINHLIQKSNKKQSQFIMDLKKFKSVTKELETANKKYIIYGLSYALMDLIEKNKFDLKNSIIIETGGMKGSREEIDKEDLHKILSTAFNTNKIHSEYAMTELMSQSYSLKNQIFSTPAWKKILIKDFNDPMNVSRVGRGFLNIIDLANKYSCPFISTEDVGEVFENGEFKLFGRGSQADLRGCNLMLADTN